MKFLKAIVVVVCFFLSMSQKPGNYWVKAFTGQTCVDACSQFYRTSSLFDSDYLINSSPKVYLKAVKAGTYPLNGETFYICASIDGRPGYQLVDWQDNKCGTAYGGKELYESNYDCLCTTDDTIMRPPSF